MTELKGDFVMNYRSTYHTICRWLGAGALVFGLSVQALAQGPPANNPGLPGRTTLRGTCRPSHADWEC